MNWIGKLLFCFSFISLFSAAENAVKMPEQTQQEQKEKISNNPLVLTPRLDSGVNAQPARHSSEGATAGSKDSSAKSRHCNVRVLLQEFGTASAISFKMESSHGFYLIDLKEKKRTSYDAKDLVIKYDKKKFYLNNALLDKQSFHIKPKQGHFKFDGKSYQGSFLILADKQTVYVINCLDIEDYVCCVLRTESWPGWPLEVNKALAICSRSYVIGVVLNQITSKLPYHIKNTNRHQTYSGVHNDPILKQAVEQTKGIYLIYDGKPIVAMFDACCGGVIPSLIQGVNFAHAPYLARNYACRFCTNARGYNWHAVHSFKQLEKMLQPEFPKVKDIVEVKNYKVDKAGVVQSVQIKTTQHTFHIPTKKLYYLLPKVRSFYFDTQTKKGKVVFTGHGIGHHLGLCQWGAREMVAQGYTYKQILDFYYPGTKFMRLSD